MKVTLYSRPGCHLCDDMKAVIDHVARTIPLTLDVVDISTDADLERRYGLEIPVLLVDGRKAAKIRVTQEELARVLKARSQVSGEAGGSGKSGGSGG